MSKNRPGTIARALSKWTIGAALALGILLPCRILAKTDPPIRLDPQNPHYFLFRGKTVVLITSGEHYGAVLNGAFNYGKYLATLQADGLNYTRVFTGTYVEVPGSSFGIRRNDLAPAAGDFIAPWLRSKAPGYAGGGDKFDLDTWNPAYFRRLHEFLLDASRRGIVVELTLFSSQYGEPQWNLSPFNSTNNINHIAPLDRKLVNTLENGRILAYQERFVRKIVREVNAFDNVIFEIQNEPYADYPVRVEVVNPYLRAPERDRFPNAVEVAGQVSLLWQAKVAGWISSTEDSLPNRHLIAQNYSNFGSPVRKLAPGVSIVNFHYAYPQAARWNYGLDLPIACDETGFLGPGDEPYRREAWNFMLAGGATFDNLDYSFSVGHEAGDDAGPNGPGGGSPDLRRELHILSAFLQSLPLAKMHPDSHTVSRAPGVVAQVLADPGRVYALYLDGKGPVTLTLRLPPGEYASRWIDTETGTTLKSESFKAGRAPAKIQSPEFKDGIALRIAAAAAP